MNIGNTCYLNSAIQFVRHIPHIRALFSNLDWIDRINGSQKSYALAVQSAALIRLLNTPEQLEKDPIAPREFADAFIDFGHEFNEDLMLGTQGDAAEAVQIILDALHSQFARTVKMSVRECSSTPELIEMTQSKKSWISFFNKEYSSLVDALFGQTKTTVTCSACKAQSTRYEPWSSLKLPLPATRDITLTECFNAHFASEIIDDYQCDECKVRGTAQMTQAISHLPQQLIIILKRFNNRGAKVRGMIPYDETLVDLSPWYAWNRIIRLHPYRVTATIEHMGSAQCGHYAMRALEDGAWIAYDDSSRYPIISGAATPNTYVLLLERQIREQ